LNRAGNRVAGGQLPSEHSFDVTQYYHVVGYLAPCCDPKLNRDEYPSSYHYRSINSGSPLLRVR
jgi:hypothetical protein